MVVRSSLFCVALILSARISMAQTSEPRDSWLMQNYRFTGPAAPGETQATDPGAELEDIQRTVLAILRKSNFAGDYEAALAAAAQAAANIQRKAALAERRRTTQIRPRPAPEPAISKPVLYTARPAQKPEAQAH
jgi:hypothetical protein